MLDLSQFSDFRFLFREDPKLAKASSVAMANALDLQRKSPYVFSIKLPIDCHRHTEERMIAKYSQDKSSLCVVLFVTLEAIEKVDISHRNEATTKYVKYDD